ncbi:putative reverse transcriptase zinc-binding domain-containing protein [Lupinus albus]|uniref:Putative reverse transcriptase zinc-binding domain-containing protein n=1 Tax=Lupinus albus TaxID=3870 RepID=A0A6A4PC66_LUPAL|nr:putative reverse transcriptase zinc-binding domain-containing protein [Lupinus albus]
MCFQCFLDRVLRKIVWDSWTPLKIRLLAWRIILDRLPSKWNLVKRSGNFLGNDVMCVWCQTQAETLNHLLFPCHFSYQIWQLLYG